MEDKVGSIEVGKYADLVILKNNLFDVAPDDIAEVKVEATMMDGRFTYRAGDVTSGIKENNKLPQLALANFIHAFLCNGHAAHEGHAGRRTGFAAFSVTPAPLESSR